MFIIAFELKFSRAFPWGFRVQGIIGLEDSMYPTVYGSNLQSVRDHHDRGYGIFMRSRRGKKTNSARKIQYPSIPAAYPSQHGRLVLGM